MNFTLSHIEYVGVFFGIICVMLTAKENIWCWPTGIISVLAYLYFYYQQTLYVNVLLHAFYLLACIIGWYQWLYGGDNKSKLKVSNTTKKHLWELAIITFGIFLILGAFSDWFSNDKMPYLDALLASMSLTAQWMMNKKLSENWLVWIVTDAVYACMHFYMKNFPSFLMYAVYIIFAGIGYYLWKKSMKTVQISK
jgi:nicotinamide mononucleotide transporter